MCPVLAGPVTRILLVDDEPAVTEPLVYLLEQAGLATVVAASGPEALTDFAANVPDLVLLDLALPGMSGFEVCRSLRATTSVPIIVLTASDAEIDKIQTLEIGADDYVTKPFSGRELIARITAVLRRYGDHEHDLGPAVLTAGPVRIDVDRHRVTVHGVRVELRLKEFTLLEFLVRHRGRVMSRGQLIERLWGEHYEGDPKRIDAIIKQLRKRVEADSDNPRHLLSIRGVGYRFEP